MPTKRYKAEQIVTLLRQIEVGIANGKTTPQVCKEAEITVQTYYRWRKEYGGLKLDQAKRLKELEKENVGCLLFNHCHWAQTPKRTCSENPITARYHCNCEISIVPVFCAY